MKPDLNAIEARCEKAISGPWELDKTGSFEICIYKGPVKKVQYGITHQGEICQMEDPDCSDFKVREIKNTAKFIAHSRTDIPALLSYIADLEAVVTAARAHRDEGIRLNNIIKRIRAGDKSALEERKTNGNKIGETIDALYAALAKLDGDTK